MDQSITPNHRGGDATAGLILISAALVSVTAAAHHPVIKAHGRDELLAQIRESAVADRLVHGVLIVCTIALLFALFRFAQRLGTQRTTVLLGLISYVFGAAAMISAALIDGFLAPEIGSSYLQAASNIPDDGVALLRFCSIAIQVFTKTGVIAVSVAILLWSAALIRAGRGPLLAAIVGVAVVLLQVYVLTHGAPAVTAHTIIPIVASMAVWYFAIGLLLIAGRI
ncbi:MAG: hypothetical protein ACREFF_03765 [Candidatus Udaeobacter sp.]